jgi:hypothetical protein
VALAQFGEDEEAVVGLLFHAEIGQRQFAHAIANGHERALVAVKLEGPVGGNVLCSHVRLLRMNLLEQIEDHFRRDDPQQHTDDL